MALVPLIQPPIMKWLTTEEERKIKMVQLRHVSKLEKIILPLLTLGICTVLLPSAVPLIGMFMLGNLAKECGVVNRLSDTIKNSLMYRVIIFLGLGSAANSPPTNSSISRPSASWSWGCWPLPSAPPAAS